MRTQGTLPKVGRLEGYYLTTSDNILHLMFAVPGCQTRPCRQKNQTSCPVSAGESVGDIVINVVGTTIDKGGKEAADTAQKLL
ncbi:MAG TPA: hypothetical protein VF172_08775 [Nitrososphaera sp.]|jgi:hypothetical protein